LKLSALLVASFFCLKAKILFLQSFLAFFLSLLVSHFLSLSGEKKWAFGVVFFPLVRLTFPNVHLPPSFAELA